METTRLSRLGSVVMPVLVSLVGIPASFAIYFAVQNSVTRLAQLQFDREASAANSILEIRLHSYTHVLYALRAQFATEASVDRVRFHRFVQALEIQRRYPGFMALNYAAYVPGNQRRQFEAAVRADTSINKEGYPNFSIKPPGERPEYFVIVYIEPMPGSEFALGLDLGSNPMARDSEKVAMALRTGRDTGNLTASAQTLRVQRPKDPIYLAMRLGVYKPDASLDTVDQRRQAYIGSVGAAFDVESLINAALDTDSLRHVRCRLYDVGLIPNSGASGSPSERRMLFDTANPRGVAGTPIAGPEERTSFVYRERIQIADRIWEFEYSSPRNLVTSGLGKVLPYLALGGGLLTTLLLFGIVYTLATSRTRAIAIAETITRDLRDSETGLAEAQRIAHMGNWALDPSAWTMTWSAETYRIFGVPPESGPVPYTVFLQRVHESDRAAVDDAIRSSLASGQDGNIEHRIAMSDGSVRWVHTIAKPGNRNRMGQVPGIVMDVTVRKQADENLMNSHEQLQALSRRLVDIQERERRRFATELHDVVGQNLTALSINLDIVNTQLQGTKNDAVQARLTDSAQLLQATTEAIENVMSELRPPMLDDYGLLPALQWYAGQFAARTGIQVKVEGDDNMERLTPAAEIALFRVAQEALNNVVKHARARNVTVCVERSPSQCVMSVTDDGEGFSTVPASTARRRPGLGMVTMRERMQAIGGTIYVEGNAGSGTRVELRVPC